MDCFIVENLRTNSYYPVDVIVSSITDVHPFFRYFDSPPYVRCLVNAAGTTLVDVRGFVQVLTNDALKTSAIVERLMANDDYLEPVDTLLTILRYNVFRVPVGSTVYVALPIRYARRLHNYVRDWYK